MKSHRGVETGVRLFELELNALTRRKMKPVRGVEIRDVRSQQQIQNIDHKTLSMQSFVVKSTAKKIQL